MAGPLLKAKLIKEIAKEISSRDLPLTTNKH